MLTTSLITPMIILLYLMSRTCSIYRWCRRQSFVARSPIIRLLVSNMLVNTITLTLLLLLLLPINITITITPLLLPTNPRLTRPIPIHNELLVLILNH
jgi:hypothetical protein